MKDTQATSGLQIFENTDFGSVRTVIIKGEPWFVGRDIAIALGYADPADALRRHCKKANKINQQGVVRHNIKHAPPVKILVIPESDVYRLIMRSQLPNAVRFQDWVCDVVLPIIRKTGSYTEAPSIPSTKLEWMELCVETERKRLLAVEDSRQKQLKLEEQQPKVDFYETVGSSEDLILMGTMAKLLCNHGIDIGSKRLFEYLHITGFLMKTKENPNAPKQKYVDQGLFRTKESSFDKAGSVGIGVTTKVTPKGQQYLIKRFNALRSKGFKYTDIVKKYKAEQKGQVYHYTNFFHKL